MAPKVKNELTATQQTMVDLALSCDLKVSDPANHTAIKARHQGIRTQRDAAQYIHEVEHKIHSRRRFRVGAAEGRGRGGI